MRKHLLLVTVIAFFTITLQAQIVNIPDANFKAYLVGNSDINTNGDDEIQVAEAAAFTGAIHCRNKSISDFTGIEAFTALTQFECGFNALKSLDVSKNTALRELYCDYNYLTSLDLSNNTALISFDCSGNQFTNLDISKNIALTGLSCVTNKLSSLDVSQNTALNILKCSFNELKSLDLSKNISLTDLECSDNQLMSLDVSNNNALTVLYCNNNYLASLNVANGNNQNMYKMFAEFNANLSCIQHDIGFNPETEPCGSERGWCKDDETAWSVSCGDEIVNIPDSNFKAYLLEKSSININGDDEIQVSEAAAFTGVIYCDGRNISDLTGIEAFTALISLDCSDNQITSLDVSKNAALFNLYCQKNRLTSLDISGNTALERLYCHDNNLTNLDISNNPALEYLRCWRNQLTSFKKPDSSVLREFYIAYNKLTSIDVPNSPDLKLFSCSGNQLTSLDVSKNTALEKLYCYDNNLTSLDISNNTSLELLWCHNNQLTGLDISGNSTLTELQCNGNQLAALDVSNNKDLKFLDCSVNQLTSLNVANGNNNNFESDTDTIPPFNAISNPNLECIQIDDGFTPTEDWKKDETASWHNDIFACEPDAVDDLYSTKSMNIYPNPATDVLMVKLNDEVKDKNLQILDLSGKVILRKDISGNSTKIDVSTLEKGVYLIKVGSEMGKLIVI